MDEQKLLKRIANILEKLKIPYITTGGVAVSVWGRPRFTADIDLVVEIFAEQVPRLTRELLKIKDGFVDQETIERAVVHQDEFNFIHSSSGIKVDFWVMKHDDAFDKERMERRIRKMIDGQAVYFASPEDVILKKLLWYQESQSTRHLEDIESIMRIQENLDVNYLKTWAERLNVSKIFKQTLAEK